MTAPVVTCTAADVLNAARKELGTLETPLGSNNVVYNTWYYGRRVSGGSYPWCAVFVSYVADQAGAIEQGIIPRHAYTPSGVNWFRARGRFGSTPRVGAVVYYNISGLGRVSHCGIVEAVYPDGSWIAIEGNTDVRGGRTGGKVMRQHRSRVGAGGGFGYPAYAYGEPVPASHSEVIYEARVDAAPGARVLSLGSVGSDVGFVQRWHGISADDQFGPDTEDHVKATQARNHVAVDGVVGPVTWGLMGVGKAPARRAPRFPLPAGHYFGLLTGPSNSHGGGRAADRDEVAKIQREVGVRADGRFGPNTRAAVIRFQRAHHLAADGQVGPRTWAALFGG